MRLDSRDSWPEGMESPGRVTSWQGSKPANKSFFCLSKQCWASVCSYSPDTSSPKTARTCPTPQCSHTGPQEKTDLHMVPVEGKEAPEQTKGTPGRGQAPAGGGRPHMGARGYSDPMRRVWDGVPPKGKAALMSNRAWGSMTQAPQLYLQHPCLAALFPQDPSLSSTGTYSIPCSEDACLESFRQLVAHSGSLRALRSTGTMFKALLVYQASHLEHLSRPLNPSVVPSFWLADEVTEMDCNHLNNSWSPRL